MKKKFKDVKFSAESRERIEQCNEIIEEYVEAGYTMTLRQLYYQLVSRDIIPNLERSYKNLSSLVSQARLAGMMDWDAIEDRNRQPDTPSEFKNLDELVEAALSSYRLPRWDGQPNYVELWVEKDALAGVLQPLAHAAHITLMVNRGYSSQSAMFESAKRFIRAERRGQRPTLLYLGDLDPSGEDMVRDIRDRMEMFGVVDLTVSKVALTMVQVKMYKPPPNPAKLTDPRAAAYVEKHGEHSWEVDALPPTVLGDIIKSALKRLVDQPMMDEVLLKEDDDKARLRRAVRSLEDE